MFKVQKFFLSILPHYRTGGFRS